MENDQEEFKKILITKIKQSIENLLLTDAVSEKGKIKIADDMLEIINQDRGNENL